MADLAGGMIQEEAVMYGSIDRRDTGELIQTDTDFSGSVDRRDTAEIANLGAHPTTWYKLRVRDSGVTSPPYSYNVWVSIYKDSTPPGTPIGSWVERTIIDSWVPTSS
jgi:hypothetical protein